MHININTNIHKVGGFSSRCVFVMKPLFVVLSTYNFWLLITIIDTYSKLYAKIRKHFTHCRLHFISAKSDENNYSFTMNKVRQSYA